MKSRVVGLCSGCGRPIDAGRSFDFICLKMPETNQYRYFHREPCWKDYLEERKP